MRSSALASPASMLGRAALAALALGTVLAFFLALPVSRSAAAEHVTVTGEYGKEGPVASGIGGGCRLAYNNASHNLYLFSDEDIYGLHISGPGTATPLGGKFPIRAQEYSGCGDPALTVDNSGNGNLYTAPASESINGWTAAGMPLGEPWPINATRAGGELCGIGVTNTGEIWAADYGRSRIDKYAPDGTPEGFVSVGFEFCKFAIDQTNNDLYVAPYSGSAPIVRLSAASGYTEKTNFPTAEDYNPGIAVNGVEGKLYVGNNSPNIKVYNTETGGLMETIETGGQYGTGRGLAVDESNDTLFTTYYNNEGHGSIREYFGFPTPKATTGEPIANDEVSGTADPNGVGPITECFFEYGTTTAYGSKQECTETTPISSKEPVHAVLPGLTDEQTYHYRLVLKNGEPNITGFGKDRTITPHHVDFLKTEAATEITQQSATLNASFNGTGEDTHYYFEWGQGTQYGNRTPVPPMDAGVTTGHTPLSTSISGLTAGATYHYRVVATNSQGESKGDDESFVTNEPPSIESFTSKNVSETSAEIDAIINPHGFETSYFVEYGPTLSYGSLAPVPSGTLAGATTAQSVAVQLTGLQGVTYHFRVVAESQWGTVRTGDQTFNFYPPACPNATLRQQTGSQYLPDCRAYELVSPAEAGGVTLRNATWLPLPLATNPARFAFGGELGALPGADASDSLSADTYVATRTNDGWETHYVGVPGSMALGDSFPVGNQQGDRFFQFLEGEGFEGVKQPRQNVPFIWDQNGNFIERWPADWEGVPGANDAEGAWQPSPDFSHLAFSSNHTPFLPGARTAAPGSAYDYNVATKTTQLISLTEDGQPIAPEPTNANSPNEFIIFPGNTLQYVNFETDEATKGKPAEANPSVSTDGSHILMSTWSERLDIYGNQAGNFPPSRLYMRVNDAVTYEVSKGHDVRYIGMTADGKKVFFTSPERLTSEDTDNSVDLYMWTEAGNKLTLLSKGGEGTGNAGSSDSCSAGWTEKCNVIPVVGTAVTDNSIAAETGEIYFYSPEQLEAQKGAPDLENLYVYREGRAQFVATMSSVFPSGQTGPIGRIQVSPDGAHAAFLTGSRLTSYDNNGIEEMYTYEPASKHIVCASCIPNGEKPHANVTASKAGLFMSNDGRVFFQTTDGLVSQDTNQLEDVYEYVDGRPQLITTGTGTNSLPVGGFGGGGNKGEEGLAGVSANGVNVYFAAREELVAQDKNGAFLAFYDARTGGGFPYEPPLAPCEAADECHGEGSSPPPPANIGSSAGLSDRGNAPNPPKHKKKHHRKKHHKKKGKKTSAKRARSAGHGKGGKHA